MTVQAVTEVLEDPEFARRAEVIVVDNGSDPQNYTILRTQLPTAARLLRLTMPAGIEGRVHPEVLSEARP